MSFWCKEETPVGLDEFNQWTKDVIALTKLPYNESMRFAVATIVLESKEVLKKKQAAQKLEKAAQNQLAAFVFQDIKSKRIAADQAEVEAKKLAEAAEESEKSVTLAEYVMPKEEAPTIENVHVSEALSTEQLPSVEKEMVPET